MQSSHNPLSTFSFKWLHLRGGVDETEDVVEDVVAALVGKKLEGLGVAHGPALLLDLCDILSVFLFKLFLSGEFRWRKLTRRAPLTTTRMPPDSLLGCASMVATWCSMRWKGSSCVHVVASASHVQHNAMTYHPCFSQSWWGVFDDFVVPAAC